jgi:hypothetical protein
MLNITDPKFDRLANGSTLKDLINLIKKNNVLPFVGAGMSAGVYPLWNMALKRLMDGFVTDESTVKISALIDERNYEKAASEIKRELGNTTYLKQLVNIFGESHISHDCLRKLSVRYLPSIFNDGVVITTNFDKILEKVFLLENCAFDEKVVLGHLTDWQAEHVIRGSMHYLIKIHGCVSAPDELILTEEKYDELYKPRVSIPIDRLRRLLFARHLLFLGCGLNQDRTLNLLKEVGLSGNYAILEMNGEPNDPEFRNRRKFVADSLGVHCIWYPKGEHHYVEDILEHISSEVNRD